MTCDFALVWAGYCVVLVVVLSTAGVGWSLMVGLGLFVLVCLVL